MSSTRWGRLPGLPLQLFVITVLPLTALLFVIAFGSLTLHQRAMRMMVGERDERATRAAAAAITEQLNHRQSAIRSVALHAANTSSLEHVVDDVSYLLQDFEGGIALYDGDRKLLAASGGLDFWQTAGVPALLEAHLPPDAAGEAHFLPLVVDENTGEEVALVAAVRGDLTAVGAFSPTSLARRALADIFAGSEEATAYVVAGGGEVVYQAGVPLWPTLPPEAHPGVVDALRGESGTTYLSEAGDELVIAFSPVPPIGWALVIAEPWRAVSDLMLRATELLPFILVPILAVALVALWFGVRRVVQPLRSLEQKATEVGWGNFEAIEEPVGGIGEIQRLQNELIHMARKVQLAQQSLRGYLSAVTAGQEEERRRLARELHDDTIQSLIALNQQIQLAQMNAADESSAARLATMQQMAEQTVADLRRLTRDLRPIYLEDLGLIPALQMLARDMSRLMEIPVNFEAQGRERRLSPNIELALYRVAQEGLSNVARHARATQADLTLRFEDGGVLLEVCDNGIGFEVPESPAEMTADGHFGLIGVQERAELIGAHLKIESTPGAGTCLRVSLAVQNGAAAVRAAPDLEHAT